MRHNYNFTLTIMALDIKVENLDDVETSYVSMFDTFKNGYNMTGGGKSLHGEASPMFGKKHTDETRAKQSASRMGDPRPKSEEWCEEHSERMKGSNNPNYGGLREEHVNNLSTGKRNLSIKKYAERGVDVTDDNIKRVLDEKNGNMLQTSVEIGCTCALVRRYCVKKKLIQKT